MLKRFINLLTILFSLIVVWAFLVLEDERQEIIKKQIICFKFPPIISILINKDLQNPISLEDLGYNYFGPLVFNFFIWLKAELKDTDKILFNSSFISSQLSDLSFSFNSCNLIFS